MPAVETIENRWDILYQDYPEIYEEFASVPYEPEVVTLLGSEFGLGGLAIADIGCGTGKSTIQLARFASKVIGVEPEGAMLDLCRKLVQEKGLNNIELRQGSAENLPLADKSVDGAVCVTTVFYPPEEVLPPFLKEAHRVVRDGGKIVLINIAPGWYGGDLHDVIEDDAECDRVLDRMLCDAGFDYRDIDTMQDYGSVDKMVSTYGFIFGRAAIEYIKHNRKTKVLWRNRIRYKFV
jgi:ubiquinone/menaquinone biosynthesis C-methylase UbiE